MEATANDTICNVSENISITNNITVTNKITLNLNDKTINVGSGLTVITFKIALVLKRVSK